MHVGIDQVAIKKAWNFGMAMYILPNADRSYESHCDSIQSRTVVVGRVGIFPAFDMLRRDVCTDFVNLVWIEKWTLKDAGSNLLSIICTRRVL